ncbi:uncharacterized protein LOC131327899 [Rhododendron vialii]|uniref:uncharacterized protein LOC131298499 n=3 Tax=Rhododendron vialii TaxID=182163 RepID=UPI00265E48CB|nr:uncharacterized protein LOC131298499 [Rhododendron vialii]XP_058181415.1 uncharacterized protein LOC131299859 [Rhododendron vialii]XP_058216971.1 uncharacterized protein LOC131327861 [Rhododendron vialii]XP_058217003.1 uncharacterized protein LOC131327899 [Rhododendron vialii]
MAPATRKQGDRPAEPQNEGLESQTDVAHPEQRVPENSQGNGLSAPTNIQGLSRQLAQVLSNPEDEAAQELITLLRRVVTPPSVIDVDAHGVVHEQLQTGDLPRQSPQQVYTNPAFDSNMNVHSRPFVEATALRSTIKPTSFYQSVPSIYEVGNSSGNGQNHGLNSSQSPQAGFTGVRVMNNGQHIYNAAQTLPNHGSYTYHTMPVGPNNGNSGQYVHNVPNIGNGNGQNGPLAQPYVPNVLRAPDPMNINRAQILEVIQDVYGPGLRRVEKPMFRKPYPHWVDNVPLPRGYKLPELSLFSGTENQSTIEHVGRFCLQLGELGSDDVFKLKLFPHSLTKTAFTWFISLPANSIHTWQDMEEQFHAQYFRHEPEVSIADLAKLKQKPNETAEQFLTRFKRLRNQCHCNVPETEIVRIAQDGLEFNFKKQFNGSNFKDLFELSMRASQFEAILQEEELLRNTSLGTYYQDVEGDIEIDVAQVIGKTPIICDTLVKTEKPMNMPSSQPNRRGGQANYRQYSFDLAQADQIFDELLKQKFVTLSPGHIIPSDKDRKGKEYCKWHNSFRHNTNNCVTFRNCVQDLIQKGLLQYAKGDKDPMGIESNPFPKIEVNMVTAGLAKRLGSNVTKQKQGEEDHMQTEEESAKSHTSRFPNDYLCIRCGHEVQYGEAIIAEKDQRSAFSKSGLRFNTMGGNDLQIYVGAKLIYEGIDPGLFNRIESEHCYGPDDGPFLFRGHPVVPARPGVPSCQDLEAAGYQFPNQRRYPSQRGVGFRRDTGPRGRGPYGRGWHQPRMVMPPNNDHEEWSTLSHPKFPAEGWYTKVSSSQKRRLQRKFAARAYGDPWDHVFEPRERLEPSKVPNMVWTRDQGETSGPKQIIQKHGGQESSATDPPQSTAQLKGKKELKQSLKKKMEEFQKLMEADDDDDLFDEGSEQEDLIKDASPSPQRSATFGESLAAIQFGP